MNPHDGVSPRGIVAGGLAAAGLDIAAAFATSTAAGPMRVLQSIASGVLGTAAYSGGATTAGLGAVLHVAIALNAAAVFYAASRMWPVLARRPLIFGPLYGLAVYAVMYGAVLPISAFPHRLTFTTASVTRNALIHVFCVGLPIAIAAKWFSGPLPGAHMATGTRRV